LKKEIILTSDGSNSIYIPELNETYHSNNGSIQEAYHVFINNGFSLNQGKPISILEIGFGTGLNALITAIEAEKTKTNVNYVGVEAYPLESNIYSNLNEIFTKIHTSNWNENISINENFTICKLNMFVEEIAFENQFDLIYFDAFAYTVQPELWSAEIFQKLYKSLKTTGILVTYACRTIIKNNMISAGFTTQKLPGALGKREMLRAIKIT
jgi:tRNA U34 5-methylaminomethyl-2-thiouridine-forming methyltransferase MnmC